MDLIRPNHVQQKDPTPLDNFMTQITHQLEVGSKAVQGCVGNTLVPANAALTTCAGNTVQAVSSGAGNTVQAISVGCIQPVSRTYKAVTTEGCVAPTRKAWQQYRDDKLSKDLVEKAIRKATNQQLQTEEDLALRRAASQLQGMF